ncbi:cytochrome b/b6 domain-containing protein [Photobacterium angustum]|uniref:cytochrome b/b6 domain-containing protein n=1 Tax=Photobacterium angustum TaxID=661 RepID=UPI0005DF187A|nr:cytochrome b/b6 domain-containing protein [Photobacterium angustum]KJF92360.1 membrane protein [Photobacterium angustum]PSW78651.1 cytochrome b/b6 domain-containing protein [Photobacterium angustum]
MPLLNSFWRYIKHYFPNTGLRHIHTSLVALVILQILNSNLMSMTHAGKIEGGVFSTLFLWVHIILGILTVVVTLAMISYMLVKQSFRQFFPYLFGDNAVLFDDLKQLRHGKLPEPREKGLGNIIQGLGIGALILIETAALLWLALWLSHSPYANDAREIHKSLTGLIEAYLIGHGGMALLHFIIERKKFA